MILKPAESFKTEIPFCSFRIWLICRYIPLAHDQCWPSFTDLSPTNVANKLYMGPATQRTRDPNIEGAGRARNVKDRVAVFKTLWKFF